MEVELGKKYRDKVTGFKGVAICHSRWLSGCDRIGLQPAVDKDGKVPDAEYFDVNRLETEIDEPVVLDETETDPGGPQREPKANRREEIRR